MATSEYNQLIGAACAALAAQTQSFAVSMSAMPYSAGGD